MPPQIGDGISKARIEALTDGVFAIVMTLLENVDLIVTGGGKSGLKQRLLGSTTSHVATQTKRPILIVK